MKIRKIMIVLIISVFLLSIASVCASDAEDGLSSDMDEKLVSDGENTVIELSDENLKTSADNGKSIDETIYEETESAKDDEILNAENDSDKLSIDESTYSILSQEIHSATEVTLSHDYYIYDEGADPIEITVDDSVIDGNGAIIDMAGSSIRALSVIASRVTIKNLTIKNANFNGNGSAICFENDGIIRDCEFIENNAIYGTVYFNKDGIMENCNFNGNNASSGAGAFFMGQGEVKNCTIANNNASDGGGIVFLNDGKLIDCRFDNNYALFSGSAIRFGTYLKISLKNCSFTNNIGPYCGAVDALHCTGTIENCNFTNNHALTSGTGGAINIKNGNLTNCTFASNSAITGGAVFTYDICELRECSFDSNIAMDDGGALSIYGGTIENSNFTNNNARYGAAVEINNGILKNCNFENNTASLRGGAISSSSATIENCSFTNNQANEGGAIEIRDGTIKKSKFTNNKAESGGAIYVFNKLSIEDSQFEGNNASDGINNILLDYEEVELTLTNVTPEYLGPFVKVYLSNAKASNVVYGSDVEVTVMANTKSNVRSKEAMTAINGIPLKDTSFSNGNLIKNDVPVRNGTVYVYIFNGGIYKGEIIDGIGKISIPGLNAGTYYGIVIYEGGSIFNRPTELISFTVTKQNAGIAAENKAYVINYGGNYIISLKDANGRPISGKSVTFKLNGKNIGSATTNAAGVATIKLTATVLKSIKSGNKNLVIEFADNNYNTVSITAKITVSKEKTKLVAKNKKFKKSAKTKKYTITLKNSKGKAVKNVKVNLKIKGKTYSAKTNSKGKAVFKIKKLNKKGTFKGTVTYKGNNYYNKVTKKVKIINK